MAGNDPCNSNPFGYDPYDTYYYTDAGINKLCEGLKGSAVTSLKCAAAECSLS